MGRKMKARSESKTVFLFGDWAIRANREAKEAIPIKGCPPSPREGITSFYFDTLPRRRATCILVSRTLKSIAEKLDVYHEAFPAHGVHNPPVFDKSHF